MTESKLRTKSSQRDVFRNPFVAVTSSISLLSYSQKKNIFAAAVIGSYIEFRHFLQFLGCLLLVVKISSWRDECGPTYVIGLRKTRLETRSL